MSGATIPAYTISIRLSEMPFAPIIIGIALVFALFIAALSSEPRNCKAGSVESLFTDCNIK